MRDEERKRSKRRGKNDANSECYKHTAIFKDHFILCYALQHASFRECILTLWTCLCFQPTSL